MSNIEQQQLAKLQETINVDQFEVARLLGQSQYAELIEKFGRVSKIKIYAYLKETKKYKGLSIVGIDGELLTVSTWQEFCQTQGKSHQHIDEEIRNLSIFGEDFLETAKRMGISYRDLRKLRKLPDAEREVIINGEAVQAEDKDSLIDLIEEMSAKHVKTKQELQKQIDELKADNTAKDNVLSTKNKKIDELDTKLSLRQQPDQKHIVEQELETHINKELAQISSSILTAISQFNAAVITLKQQATDSVPHLLPRIEQDVSYVYNRIAELAVAEGIEIDLASMVTPEWMADIVNMTDKPKGIKPSQNREQDAKTFREWREQNGHVYEDDDFELQGQTPEELEATNNK